ncbi:hypothetical protein PILCRDRAFT_407431 [Piloderma croceum F 1598]|uniref:Uncharacterized protein n=1 Tax=Piloderma croceum (strain F 1598) TaxID=765440 RepID=A0A0C3FIU1_PILCF|nr:hypothetical protein PILCRDRAFT_407431 [Piloderma croceum F 1598]
MNGRVEDLVLCTCLEDGEMLSIQKHVSRLCDRKESDIVHLFVFSISGQSTTTLVSLLRAIYPCHSRHSIPESQCGTDATERNMTKSESVHLRAEVAPCCMICLKKWCARLCCFSTRYIVLL